MWNQREVWKWCNKWENFVDAIAGKKVTLSCFMNLYMVRTEGQDPLHLDFHFIVPLIMVQYLIVAVLKPTVVKQGLIII